MSMAVSALGDLIISPPVQGPDGNFYGAALGGGPSNDGTIYKLTPTGALTSLVQFTGTGGYSPGDSPNALVNGGSELVGVLERGRHFLDLPFRFLGAEVDGRADADGPHVEGLLDAGEEDLIEAVGIRQEFIVVDLEDERNLVGVLARHRAQDAERGGDAVAAPFDGELDDRLGIEVIGIGGE